MSKFVDKLKRVSQAVTQPMGFGRGQIASPTPKMLLVASLAEVDVSKLADLVAGADAGLLNISEWGGDSKILQEYADAVSDIPWGGWLKTSEWRGGEKLEALHCDFVVFPAAQTPIRIFDKPEVGKILEVRSSLGEGILRTINELPVDGVLITVDNEDSSPITWQQLMLFQRFADLLAKPLLIPVPAKVTAGELRMLWESGVDGVIVKVGAGQPRGRLKKLRGEIDKLPLPSQGRRARVKALLPKISREAEVVGEEDLPSDL